MASGYRYGYGYASFSPAMYRWTSADERSAKPARGLHRGKNKVREKVQPNRTIHCLPEEVMLTIFGLLDLADLARSVVPVCTRWYRLGRDESLWIRATLRYDPTAESERPGGFVRALMTAPVIGSVEYISDDNRGHEEIAEALTKGCPRIHSLTLLPWHVSYPVLRRILERSAAHLQHLEIIIPDLSVLAIIGFMENLRSLVLHGEVSYVSDLFLKLESGCPHLSSLDLGGLRFNDLYRLDALMEAVVRGHARTLTALKLPPNLTTAKVLHAVALCTNLKVLAIWITHHITTAVLTKALQMLELESLTWRNYDGWLDSAELAQFIMYSDKFLALREFKLVDCIDMDNGLALAIAHRCRNLRRLSLHRSELSAEGLHEILVRAHALEALDVYKNTCFNVGHLEMMALHMKALRDIDLRGCYLIRGASPLIWARVREQLPQLKIRFD